MIVSDEEVCFKTMNKTNKSEIVSLTPITAIDHLTFFM